MHSISTNDLRGALAEFLSSLVYTFFVVGALSADGGSAVLADGSSTVWWRPGYPHIAFATGFVVLLLIYAFRDVSGGHINPTVTFAYIMGRAIPLVVGVLYLFFQFWGAVCGALLVRMLVGTGKFRGQLGLHDTQFALGTNSPTSEGSALALEAFAAALLVFVSFATSIHPAADPEQLILAAKSKNAPWPIGLTYFCVTAVLLPFTGAGLHPARVIATYWVGEDNGDDVFWLYLLGPAIGAFFGLLAYYLVYGHWEGGMHPGRLTKQEQMRLHAERQAAAGGQQE